MLMAERLVLQTEKDALEKRCRRVRLRPSAVGQLHSHSGAGFRRRLSFRGRLAPSWFFHIPGPSKGCPMEACR